LLRRGGGNPGPVLGVSASMRRMAQEVAKLPADAVPVLRARWSEPRFFRDLAAAIRALPACAVEAMHQPPPRHIPLVVLSGSHRTREYREAHEALAATVVVVEGSAHWIHLDRPELVARTVLDVSTTAMGDVPLLIDFVAPSTLLRERDRPSALPIVGNGPPGTFVLFPDGLRISIPTDQIVYADDRTGHARVGFGGMQFVGVNEQQLVFVRFREVLPDEQLSPARSHTMRLAPARVQVVTVAGGSVWRRSG
jgi:hypothetical protein